MAEEKLGRAVVFGFVATVIALVAVVPARAEDWQLLGSSQFAFDGKPVVVEIESPAGISKVKLQLRRTGAYVNEMTIRFADGSEETLDVREFVQAGSDSDELEIVGRDKQIAAVEVCVRCEGHSLRQRSKLKVWGAA